MKRRLPPERNWAVWIAGFERRDWKPEWISTPIQLIDGKKFLIKPNVTPTYNISTQVIGKLFIQVMHTPMRNFVKRWRFTAPEKGSIFRIWPQTCFSVAWPGRMLTDRDADFVATALNQFIRSRVRERIGSAQKT